MRDYPIKSPRKLIEVALPLDAINAACAREKSIRHGHPSTLHLWWARRPLAAARAVIFAQLVNDPGYQQGGGFKYGKNKKDAAIERKRLFGIIEDLVKWENTTNEEVLERARAEIRRSWREVCELNKDHPQAAELFNPDKLPALHDPFAGGGAIPLEAQRLGLEAHASDLNPVAVIINKAMIEIPPKFTGRVPVSLAHKQIGLKDDLGLGLSWPSASGLAQDIRYYGKWMHDEAQKRIGHFYPMIKVVREKNASYRQATTSDIQNPKLKIENLVVLSWLWARTVKSPNPAYSHVDVPLATTFILSSKTSKEVYVHPVVKYDQYTFTIKTGIPPIEARAGTSSGKRKAFRCLLSGTPIDYNYIRAEGMAGRLGQKLMAVVARGANGRVYIAPSTEMEALAFSAVPTWKPNCVMPKKHRNFQPPAYGMNNIGDLFTPRQLVALTTFSELVGETRDRIYEDAIRAGMAKNETSLDQGGLGAAAYADAIALYLGITSSKAARFSTTLSVWRADEGKLSRAFGRQAIPMTWDFAETNPFSNTGGDFEGLANGTADVLENLDTSIPGIAQQANAMISTKATSMVTISTDPPYYDNIAYADLSDYFYVWLRKSLKSIFPRIFATVTVPKAEELVATPYRFGSKEKAETFFLDGMTCALKRLAERSHPVNPITIYYAFKQSETVSEGTTSTGWETFLQAVLHASLSVVGTWPVRTEGKTRMNSMDNSSLASSIVLVCRKRPIDAPYISRREFIRELNGVLPEALDEMTKGSGEDRSPVAPVDLSQAIIGPGMAVFSKYSAVLEADGSPMSVRTALQLINRFLAEDDFDADTQFCLHWFDQYGWGEGRYGEADTLSRAKGTSVNGVRDAGVVESGGGVVRIRKWSEYPAEWDPKTDTRNPVWETLHHLIRAMRQEGDSGAGRVLAAVKGKTEAAQQLAYRLYTLCERRGWAEDARAYNELITSWTGIESAAGSVPTTDAGMLPGFEEQ
jgi:putative DNA methylase